MPEREEIDLGWANSWGEDPEVARRCKEQGHTTRERQIEMFVHEVICLQCGYVYRYDSS